MNKKVEGFGVIDKLIAPGPEPVFRADGYRMRISSTTEIKFGGGLTSLADVGTNIWIRYEGRRVEGGELRCYACYLRQSPTIEEIEPPQTDLLPTQPSLIDANGKLVGVNSKVRMSDWSGPCGLHRVVMDRAMQEPDTPRGPKSYTRISKTAAGRLTL